MTKFLAKSVLFSTVFSILCVTANIFSQEFASFNDSKNTEIAPKTLNTSDIKPTKTFEFVSFHTILERNLVKQKRTRTDLCDEKDAVSSRILKDYGSVFLVIEQVLPPPVCIFLSSKDVENFQNQISISKTEINGATIELQTFALEALLKARTEAQLEGFDITPRDGSIAGKRSFDDTYRLWKSRFEPACNYWLKKGKLTIEQVTRLKSLPMKEQVNEVLLLEKQGIYFNTAFNNSILYSVAAPGTSQHLALLAFDVNEYQNERVREILAKYGWFRTVQNDSPHFTFLGHKETDLRGLGLKLIFTGNGKFWIPNA